MRRQREENIAASVHRSSGRALGALVLLASGALSLGSCGPSREARSDVIRIGVVLSLTGGLADFGPSIAEASRLAVREVEAAGGLLGGRPIELLIRDDRTDPAFAAELVQELIDVEGVVAVTGALSSEVTLRIQEQTRAAGLPQVSCCSTSQALRGAQPATDRWLYRTAPSDDLQGGILARYAAERGCTRLGVVHLDDAYGNGLAATIEESFRTTGGSVVSAIAIPSEQPSYQAAVMELSMARPDCTALATFSGEAGVVVREWDDAGLGSMLWIGTDAVKSRGFVDAAGGDARADGVFGTAPITDPERPQYAAFLSDYQATFGHDPGLFASAQFDAVALILLGLEEAGGTDGQALRDAMLRVSGRQTMDEAFFGPGQLADALIRIRDGEDIDYVGASGPVDFDASGDVRTDFEIWRYAGGQGFVQERVIRAEELP